MWTTTFNQDTEVEGVGTVTATCDKCIYSRKVDTNDSKDVESFVAEAKEKHSATEQKEEKKATVADIISIELNK